MSKLIQLQVLEAKNVICGTEIPKRDKEYGNYGEDFWCGIDSDDAQRDFNIPSHIIIGLFDDGSTRVAGIDSLNELNEPLNTDNLNDSIFFYDTIINKVGIHEAKAFVRYFLYAHEDYEKKAIKYEKKEIYEELIRSGVEIDDEAKDYLLG
jgi:hypothetical protein